MQLDWVTVVAQIVNFLILVYLLKRFLYRPILRAMDQRETRIAERLGEADSKVESAERLKLSYEMKQKMFEEERDALLAEARGDADAERNLMLQALRKELEEKRATWMSELERDREIFQRDLRLMLGGQVVDLARRTLRDLADVDLQEQMVRIFLNRIENAEEGPFQDLPKQEKQWNVLTVFDLPPESQEFLRHRLGGILPEGVELHFKHRPDLVSGIALEAGGRRWEWSVDAYLKEVERKVAAALTQPDKLRGDVSSGG